MAGRLPPRVCLPLQVGRLVGGAEAAVGLALLDRAPIEPAALYCAVAPVDDAVSPVWRDWLRGRSPGSSRSATSVVSGPTSPWS